MKRTLLASLAAITMIAGASAPGALAQGVVVTVEPEYRTRIKEYVVREKIRPVTVKERVRVGARLPADVELRPVPEDWGPSVRRYRYVYHDDRVVFVDPDDREVVHVLD